MRGSVSDEARERKTEKDDGAPQAFPDGRIPPRGLGNRFLHRLATSSPLISLLLLPTLTGIVSRAAAFRLPFAEAPPQPSPSAGVPGQYGVSRPMLAADDRPQASAAGHLGRQRARPTHGPAESRGEKEKSVLYKVYSVGLQVTEEPRTASHDKVLWGELLQLLLLLWYQAAQVSPVAGLSAHCRCVTFDDMYGKEYGVFTSPNYPVPYEENIECVLFRFIGNTDQIVRISFEEFDVQRSNLECVYGDYVKLFLHLDKEEAVNNRSPYNSILCGKINDIEQTHYSSGHALIFEFHSDWRQGNNSGFRGTYRFLSKRQFETDGVAVPDSRCSFIMDSGNRSTGRFFSPQYPSSYPRDIKCAYSFLGRENERVKVLFEQVRLQRGDFSCFNSPDVILVHDGRDGSAPVIGQLCNRNVWVEMMSTGPDLYVTFSAQSHFPGRGFMAKYIFSETPYNGTLDQLVSIGAAGISARIIKALT
ncbi:hypothetical protein MTO96_010802 [Rhipicephalus appendiculatus]